MAAAYDDESVYIAYECSPAPLPGQQGNESSRTPELENVHILVDSAATEQGYRAFVVTADGEQGQYIESYSYPIAGRFVRRRWDAPWALQTSRDEDRFVFEAALPCARLGTARPGDVWRFNVVAEWRGSDGQPITGTWASPEAPFYLPRNLGTLHGTLVFE